MFILLSMYKKTQLSAFVLLVAIPFMYIVFFWELFLGGFFWEAFSGSFFLFYNSPRAFSGSGSGSRTESDFLAVPGMVMRFVC